MHKRLLLFLVGLSLLAGCGGGGSSSSDAHSDQSAEKAWVRAHLDDVYLWYDEIVDVPSANYATAPAYFDGLLVKSRDRFSFSMPLAEAVSTLQLGRETGYGVTWGWDAAGRLYAWYVDPNSPAATLITRGTELTGINGKAVSTLDTYSVDSALFPGQAGTAITLTYRSPGGNAIHTQSLISATFSVTTVDQPQIVHRTDGGKVGYLLFNKHLLTSEQLLADSMRYFQQQGIGELVLDMRYNPGGYLSIAEEVASMIGGAAVQGKVFERQLFNSKHPEKTGDPANTLYFSERDSKGNPLPMLDLSRVFVLTGANTCSASEAVINGLLPHIQVIRVGWTTCGKPYGFIQTNYDQQAYFAVQMEAVNANGTGKYTVGFPPTCQVADDLNHSLGDSREARLSAALYYMSNNSCPAAAMASLPKAVSSNTVPGNGEIRMIGRKPELKLLR
jgi:C-terminal processing protease CtpA/Prc